MKFLVQLVQIRKFEQQRCRRYKRLRREKSFGLSNLHHLNSPQAKGFIRLDASKTFDSRLGLDLYDSPKVNGKVRGSDSDRAMITHTLQGCSS